jgi:hypothetical protein
VFVSPSSSSDLTSGAVVSTRGDGIRPGDVLRVTWASQLDGKGGDDARAGVEYGHVRLVVQEQPGTVSVPAPSGLLHGRFVVVVEDLESGRWGAVSRSTLPR